jgi:hypothetical protein
VNELTLKIQGFIKEARQRRKSKEFFSAGTFYQRAARVALKARKSPNRYFNRAIKCYEEGLEIYLSDEAFSEAAETLERIAQIHELNGERRTAADIRLRASYLRLKSIENLMR